MDLSTRTIAIADMQRTKNLAMFCNLALTVALLIAVIVIFTQEKTIIQQVPGSTTSAELRPQWMDRGSERAILLAVTSNLAQVNPTNAHYQKIFLQAFLAPQVYTAISAQIDAKAKRLAEQRELGSYYFVFRHHKYDPKINRHFVMGNVHTVNAAIDTPEPYVFEYATHVESYRLVVDDVVSYKGDKPHDAAWREAQKK